MPIYEDRYKGYRIIPVTGKLTESLSGN